jgi:hypothetical protein
MAANVPNPGLYLSGIANYLTGVRDNLAKLVDQRAYIESMGGEAFLTNTLPDGLGMAAADAQALIATLDQHNDLSTGYTGGTPAPQLDYKNNGAPFWGGM